MIGLGNEFATRKTVEIPPDTTQKNNRHRFPVPVVTQWAGEGLRSRIVDIEVNHNQVGVMLPGKACALDRRTGCIGSHSSTRQCCLKHFTRFF